MTFTPEIIGSFFGGVATVVSAMFCVGIIISVVASVQTYFVEAEKISAKRENGGEK